MTPKLASPEPLSRLRCAAFAPHPVQAGTESCQFSLNSDIVALGHGRVVVLSVPRGDTPSDNSRREGCQRASEPFWRLVLWFLWPHAPRRKKKQSSSKIQSRKNPRKTKYNPVTGRARLAPRIPLPPRPPGKARCASGRVRLEVAEGSSGISRIFHSSPNISSRSEETLWPGESFPLGSEPHARLVRKPWFRQRQFSLSRSATNAVKPRGAKATKSSIGIPATNTCACRQQNNAPRQQQEIIPASPTMGIGRAATRTIRPGQPQEKHRTLAGHGAGGAPRFALPSRPMSASEALSKGEGLC